jgi:hypothetical protein
MNLNQFRSAAAATPRRPLRLGVLPACLFLAIAGGEALAQAKVKRDDSGRIVALSNLSPSRDCSPAHGAGQVTERHLEEGVVRGIDFRDSTEGQFFINVPALYNFKSRSVRAEVVEAYESLLQKDQDLTIGYKVCGASGRILKLDSVALANSSGAAASPKTSATEEGKWTYGRHPILGLSAHIQAGEEAVGLACAYHGSHPAHSDTASFRITPGLSPRATETEGAIIGFEGLDGTGGAYTFKSNPRGYLEVPESSCGIPSFQTAKALLFVKGEFVSLDARGKKNVLTIRREGKTIEFSSGADLAKLPDTIRVSLEGSRAAIARLMRACPAIKRNDSWDCPL